MLTTGRRLGLALGSLFQEDVNTTDAANAPSSTGALDNGGDGDGEGGLVGGVKAGIGAGVGVAGLVMVGGLGYILVRRCEAGLSLEGSSSASRCLHERAASVAPLVSTRRTRLDFTRSPGDGILRQQYTRAVVLLAGAHDINNTPRTGFPD